MRITDLTQNCPQELILQVDNDQWLAKEWRKTLRTGNMAYIKDAFEEAGFTYRKDQWDELVEEFEDELAAEEKRMEEQAKEAETFYFTRLADKSN